MPDTSRMKRYGSTCTMPFVASCRQVSEEIPAFNAGSGRARVPALLAQGAEAWGFPVDRCTGARVAELLRSELGVRREGLLQEGRYEEARKGYEALHRDDWA